MDLRHRFTVPTPVEETWAHFQDLTSLAECFPGATLTSVEEDSFAGSCKVKLGPIALVYLGSGRFVEKDDTAHRFVVEATGKDKRGNGTAGATVTLAMGPSDGGTDVEVVTDLAVTGKPAQFGRGVMQDVSDKLLGQFVSCLEARLAGPDLSAAPDSAEGAADGDEAGTGAPAEGEREDVGVRAVPSTPGPGGGPQAVVRPAGVPPRNEALDLGAAVVPVLLKSYWKQGLAALVLALLVVWLVRRD